MPKKLIDALTDADIRNAKPVDRDGVKFDRKLVDGRGLYLLVRVTTGDSTKQWRLKFRFAGRERLLALGEYPDVSLKVARERAAKARDLARQGIDPVQHKREEKTQRENAALQTFEIVAEQWMLKRAKSKRWTGGHIEQNRQSLRDYVYPKLGRRPVASLTAQDITRVLNPLEQDGKIETLRRVRQRVGSVLSFAVQTGLRTDNPIRDLSGAFEAPQRQHFASIRPAELPAFLARLDAYQGHPNTVGIVRMILWTASRTGEIRGARKEEFDLDARLWRIPAERMKKRRPHVVPLPRQAVAMLRELIDLNDGSDLMFPSSGKPDQMASENIVLQALDKMGYGGKLTGHGLRATVSTGLEEMGYSIELVKAQLSHSKGDLTNAAYLRGVHTERRCEMMQTWADTMQAGATGKVLPIRRQA